MGLESKRNFLPAGFQVRQIRTFVSPSTSVVLISLLGTLEIRGSRNLCRGWLGEPPGSDALPVMPITTKTPAHLIQCFYGQDETHTACPQLAQLGAEEFRRMALIIMTAPTASSPNSYSPTSCSAPDCRGVRRQPRFHNSARAARISVNAIRAPRAPAGDGEERATQPRRHNQPGMRFPRCL